VCVCVSSARFAMFHLPGRIHIGRLVGACLQGVPHTCHTDRRQESGWKRLPGTHKRKKRVTLREHWHTATSSASSSTATFRIHHSCKQRKELVMSLAVRSCVSLCFSTIVAWKKKVA
jgi:hypothetical protein